MDIPDNLQKRLLINDGAAFNLLTAGFCRMSLGGARGTKIEFTTEETLRAEANAIHGEAPTETDTGAEFYRKLNGLDSAALCLSGGGIRSAAFGLGVIQALAAHPRSGASTDPSVAAAQSLLAKFHFLSTVSGGGYIGSWLSAWRLEKPFSEIREQLVGRPLGADSEPSSIQWLRTFSNYLTPQIGLTSADTWAALAVSARNLVLNWFVILPPICGLILFVKLVGVLSTWLILWGITARWDGYDPTLLYIKVALQLAAGAGAVISLVIALVLTIRGRPGCKPQPTDRPNQIQFLWGTLFWSVLSAFLLVNFLASDFVGLLLLKCKEGPVVLNNWASICVTHIDPDNNKWLTARHSLGIHMAVGAVPAAIIYATAWLFAGRRTLGWRDFWAWAVSGGVYGALVAAAGYLYLIIPDEGFHGLQVYFLHLCFGVPWVLFSQTTADMIFVGLSSYETSGDADREWFGRSAGWFLAVIVVWLFLTFFVFFGTIVSQVVSADQLKALQSYTPVVAAISGVVTAIFGKSAGSPAEGKPKGIIPYITSLILPVAAVIFVAALLVIVSFALDRAIFGDSLMPKEQKDIDYCGRLTWLGVGLICATAISFVSSWSVNINRFSCTPSTETG